MSETLEKQEYKVPWTYKSEALKQQEYSSLRINARSSGGFNSARLGDACLYKK